MSPKPSPPLFHSVNKPTLQLSAPSCPLLHTIYLFAGVATPLALPLFLPLCFLPSFPFFGFPLPCKALHAKWWIQAIRVPPTSPEQQSFLASRPPALLSQLLLLESWNILDSHYLQVRGLQMSQDHKTVLWMALPRWIDPVQSPHWNKVRSSVAWEQAQSGRGGGSIAASVGGDRRGYLPSTTGVGPVYCFTFGSWNWKCSCLRGLHVGHSTVWRTVFRFFSAFFFLFSFSTHCSLSDFTVFVPSLYKLILTFCVAAIHQRLESDGTERVEGSMTQRLENILNSKHLFI